ncbi:MAG: DUF3153 domain-containing protein [Luteolibacter sp.]
MPKSSSSSQDAIEVEVVEIDGVSPAASRQASEDRETRSDSARGDWQQWQSWPGKIKTLDARWWPLWVVLGILAVFLILTVGVVLGAVFLIARLIRNILVGFVSLFSPPSSTGLSR